MVTSHWSMAGQSGGFLTMDDGPMTVAYAPFGGR